MEKLRTIDITPTWRGILPVLVHVASSCDHAEGRKVAMDELLRLADIVDSQIEAAREMSVDESTLGNAAGVEDDWPYMVDTSEARRLDEKDGVYA